MAKEYKVWVCVEEYDTETGIGEDVDLNFPSTRTFSRLQHAVDFATALHLSKILKWRGLGAKVYQE